MMKCLFTVALFFFVSRLFAQPGSSAINEMEVNRILNTLSADSMQGRHALSGVGIGIAAAFIEREFSETGLLPLRGNQGLAQEFEMYKSQTKEAKLFLEGIEISVSRVFCHTTDTLISINEGSGYEQATIEAGDNFLQKYRNLRTKTNPLVVWVDTSHSALFDRMSKANQPRFAQAGNQIFVLKPGGRAGKWTLHLKLKVDTFRLKNLVGIIPGTTRPNEYVIFSGHYDHLGIGKPNARGDSIYNGANDDASGTTAVIMLAKHFKIQTPPARTLVFAAFTAEEIGGYGSQYFSRQLPPDQVMAMFNIEMIGTDSKWGLNSAFITGYEKTDMGAILQRNLATTGFNFQPDPYPQQQLFYRSDNATLARLGVPAHTISTSKMDNEPHYHKPSDEAGTLDAKNMTAIIWAIALSSRSIVSGQDTPSRVDTVNGIR